MNDDDDDLNLTSADIDALWAKATPVDIDNQPRTNSLAASTYRFVWDGHRAVPATVTT